MATSSYYVPDSSYFPIVASFGLIGMAAGGGGMMNHMSSGGVGYAFPHLVFLVGTLLLAFVLFNWFSKVVVESRAGMLSLIHI